MQSPGEQAAQKQLLLLGLRNHLLVRYQWEQVNSFPADLKHKFKKLRLPKKFKQYMIIPNLNFRK